MEEIEMQIGLNYG
jgi:hypothetical protein